MPGDKKIPFSFVGKSAHLNKTFKQINQRFSKLGGRVSGFTARTANAFRGLDYAAVSAFRGIGRAITSGIIDPMNYAEKVRTEFNSAITKMGDSTVRTGKRQLVSTRKLKEQMGNVAAVTKFTQLEIAEAMHIIGRAGKNSLQMFEALPKAARLAETSNYGLANSIQMTIEAMNIFGIKRENMTKTMAVMVDVTNSTNMSMAELREGYKKSGAMAQAAGTKFEGVAAILGILADAGIKGSVADTALRNIFLAMTGKGGQAGKIMDNLKAHFKKEGILFNAPNVLLAISKSVTDVSKRAKLLNKLFGLRGVSGGLVAMKKISKIQNMQARLTLFNAKSSAEYMKKTEDSMKKGLRTSQSMRSSADNLKAAWGDVWLLGMQPANRELATMFKNMTKSVEKSEELKDFVANVGTLLKGAVITGGELSKVLAKIVNGYAKIADWTAEGILNPKKTVRTILEGKIKEHMADVALRNAGSPEAIEAMKRRNRMNSPLAGLGHESAVQSARSAEEARNSKHILEIKNAPKGSRLFPSGQPGIQLSLGDQMVVEL